MSYEEGQLLAEKNGMVFLETSAKYNTNVREMFLKAGLEIMKDVKGGLIQIDDAGSQGVKRNKDFKQLDAEQNRIKLQSLGQHRSHENSSEKCC